MCKHIFTFRVDMIIGKNRVIPNYLHRKKADDPFFTLKKVFDRSLHIIFSFLETYC